MRSLSPAKIAGVWRAEVPLEYIAAKSGKPRSVIGTLAKRLGWPERTRAGRLLSADVIARFEMLWRAGAAPAWIESKTGIPIRDQNTLAFRRRVFRPVPRACAGVAYDEEKGLLREQRGEVILRTCLRCPTSFQTDSPYLRLCPACRHYAAHGSSILT